MRKVGYVWLKEKFGIETLDYWITSYVRDKGNPKTVERDGYIQEIHRAAAWPGDTWHDHLEFALKREGLHMELLYLLMPKLPWDELIEYITATPTGRYTRIVWYLYEAITWNTLPIDDLTVGNYAPLLDSSVYLTAKPKKIRRQRIDDNLLGSINFSPMVRHGDLDLKQLNFNLRRQCNDVVSKFPASIYQRAVNYLYAKESKSSYAIERETPSAQHARQFINLLERAWQDDFLNMEGLVELQNAIVDPRFRNDGYRDTIDEQIYIGETIAPGNERIHYAAPKPEDVAVMMREFIACSRKILADKSIPDITAAAIISYLFNYIHPFSDGNGRIHRFLMHHVLAKREFGPKGIILPVSAVILNRPKDYDMSLESFSQILMDKISYDLDDRLRMTIRGETINHYRFIDCSKLNAIFHDFVQQTIESELPAEIEYLQRHDKCRVELRTIVDLPDRIAELFIKCCIQNAGILSKNKRQLPEFAELTDTEITELERIVSKNFLETSPS